MSKVIMTIEVPGCYVLGGDATTFTVDLNDEDTVAVLNDEVLEEMEHDIEHKIRGLARNVPKYRLVIHVFEDELEEVPS